MMRELAERFVKENDYSKQDFEETDVGTELENEVCEWIDSIKGTLMNYEDYEWEYKNKVYEEVCDILEVK